MIKAEWVAAWLVVFVAYGTASLYTARLLYGTARAYRIDYRAKNHPLAKYDPVQWFNMYDQPLYIATYLMAGIFWPGTLLTLALFKVAIRGGLYLIEFMDRTKIRSNYEKINKKGE